MTAYEAGDPADEESLWDEAGYGVPDRCRLKRVRQAYEEAEREDLGDE